MLGGDGAQAEPMRIIARGGGWEQRGGAARLSAYRSELWGVVCALRALCVHVHQRGGRVGPVYHWSDNSSLCKFLTEGIRQARLLGAGAAAAICGVKSGGDCDIGRSRVAHGAPHGLKGM